MGGLGNIMQLVNQAQKKKGKAKNTGGFTEAAEGKKKK